MVQTLSETHIAQKVKGRHPKFPVNPRSLPEVNLGSLRPANTSGTPEQQETSAHLPVHTLEVKP